MNVFPDADVAEPERAHRRARPRRWFVLLTVAALVSIVASATGWGARPAFGDATPPPLGTYVGQTGSGRWIILTASVDLLTFSMSVGDCQTGGGLTFTGQIPFASTFATSGGDDPAYWMSGSFDGLGFATGVVGARRFNDDGTSCEHEETWLVSLSTPAPTTIASTSAPTTTSTHDHDQHIADDQHIHHDQHLDDVRPGHVDARHRGDVSRADDGRPRQLGRAEQLAVDRLHHEHRSADEPDRRDLGTPERRAGAGGDRRRRSGDSRRTHHGPGRRLRSRRTRHGDPALDASAARHAHRRRRRCRPTVLAVPQIRHPRRRQRRRDPAAVHRPGAARPDAGRHRCRPDRSGDPVVGRRRRLARTSRPPASSSST